MKLLIMIGVLLSPNLSQAKIIINPVEDDYSFTLKKGKNTVKSKTACKGKKGYKPCTYQHNDYRSVKNSAFGCAVNNNKKNASDNGDVCN
ncbi:MULTISPECIES: hypothetical protein [Yersinia]|uniref:Uncharacterized protein n=1 Tax=Yersinia frederiksenii TaxID=29484 RepID=A0AAI8ZUX7_YERFR|nr:MULTISPECIES: hypothetical protein [Yersinia]MDN0129262.1 hypothetical protein [Yersinia massiliensis]CFR14397.1 Uncharacterised protein [Yersinia frederiksenii]HEI6966803.1 hypothetical protein [Yersinia enterocolitica]